MIRLIATSPAAGLTLPEAGGAKLPQAGGADLPEAGGAQRTEAGGGKLTGAGGTKLSEVSLSQAWMITAFDSTGAARALGAAGFTWPGAGELQRRQDAALIWAGPDQAMLLNASPPDPGAAAAVTETGDGLAWLRLSGPLAEAALARLVPLDLRPVAFGARQAARSLLGKHDVTLMRSPGGDGFDLLLDRTSCVSAIAALEAALQLAAAR